MKKVAIWTCALALAGGAAYAASGISKDEVKRLNEAGSILTELRNTPEKGIPEDLWNKAECVIVIPSMKKAAFVIGGEYGSGVMSCRSQGAWSSPVFMQLTKGSWGLQIGAESTDLVLLLMNRRGLEKLLEDKVSLGADASAAAGPIGRHGSAATDAQMSAEMLSYSRSQGVFAGIDLSGGVLHPDKEADARAYGPNVTAHDIVNGSPHIAKLDQATPFIHALGAEARATTGRKPQ
jgi:lipid-binding SYLF domain-containing protein